MIKLIRQLFCKHAWEYDAKYIHIYRTCSKCEKQQFKRLTDPTGNNDQWENI